MKIVINRCYGGFGLSEKALVEIASAKCVNELNAHDIPRDDPDLVAVVESLGERSWGEYSKLKVVEVPDGVEWFIHEYDGMEHVAEKHRTWGE